MKTTQIQQIRIQVTRNLNTIQQMTGVTDFQYKEIIFESGIYFLEKLFQNDRSLIQKISFDKSFWAWWRSEFSHWEMELIECAKASNFNVDFDYWLLEINSLIIDKITFQGFKNYLKIFHNVRI